MAIHKNLKKRLSEEQIEAYMKWEERWKGKRWYGEDGNKRFDELLEIVLPGYKRKGEVIGGKKKVLVECNKGHDWNTFTTSILAGSQCPKCSQQKQIRDVQDVCHFIFEKHGIKLDIATYEGMHKPAKFQCKNGAWFSGKPNQVEQGIKKCPCAICKKERRSYKRRTKQEYIEELKEKGFIMNANDWKGAVIKSKMWCVDGNHWTEQRPDHILNSNVGCVICSGNAKYSLDVLQKELFGPEGYTIREGAVYVNTETPLPLICPEGHECEISVTNFKRNKRCRHCYLESISGENSNLYDHNKTDEERRELEEARQDPRYFKARRLSKQRDNRTCVICGMTEKEAEIKGLNHVQKSLNGHHLFSFANFKKARYILDNWITLCYWCHKDDFHAKYGRDGTTNGFQFLEWIESKNVTDELKETIRERVERVYGFIESNFDNYDDYVNYIGENKKGTA